MKKNIILLVLTIGLSLSVAYLMKITNTNSPSPSPMSHLGGPFTLKGANGPVSLKDFKNRVVVLYFGFTTCPDICPMSLTKLKNELKKLNPKERSKVQPIFISVDWKRDDAKKAQEYASFFGDNIIGLAGDKKSIDEVTKKYAVFYDFVDLKDSELGFTVDHTSRFFVIDGNSKLINSFTDIKGNSKFIKTIKKEIRSLK